MLFSGTANSNVKCERCPSGTFSDTTSYTDPCRNHTKWVKDSHICIQLFGAQIFDLSLSLCSSPAVTAGLLLDKATLHQTPCVKPRFLYPAHGLKPQQKSLTLRLCSRLQVRGWGQSRRPQTPRLHVDRWTPRRLSAICHLFQRQHSTSQQKARCQTQCLTANWVTDLVFLNSHYEKAVRSDQCLIISLSASVLCLFNSLLAVVIAVVIVSILLFIAVILMCLCKPIWKKGTCIKKRASIMFLFCGKTMIVSTSHLSSPWNTEV